MKKVTEKRMYESGKASSDVHEIASARDWLACHRGTTGFCYHF